MSEIQQILESEVKKYSLRLGDCINIRTPPTDCLDDRWHAQVWLVESDKPLKFKHLKNTVSYFDGEKHVVENIEINDDVSRGAIAA